MTKDPAQRPLLAFAAGQGFRPCTPRAIPTTRRMRNGLIGMWEVPARQREAAGLMVCKGHKMEEFKVSFKHTSSPGVACTSVIPVAGVLLWPKQRLTKRARSCLWGMYIYHIVGYTVSYSKPFLQLSLPRYCASQLPSALSNSDCHPSDFCPVWLTLLIPYLSAS